MQQKIIGTWRMAYFGLKQGVKSETIREKIIDSIKYIENYEHFKSVGFGGLPNINKKVELDAGFMDGRTAEVGSIMAVRDIANPIDLAYSLSKNKFNRFLAGKGATKEAEKQGLRIKDMLGDKAARAYEKKIRILDKNPKLSPYDGHDTVCFVGTDMESEMIAATSTSGLFMKKKGRVGDSPLPGSGFFADNQIGAAAATGLGEDIARGVLSYETVRLMQEGKNPSEAAQAALDNLTKKLASNNEKIGPISIIAIDKNGNWGIGTNCLFQFAVYENDEVVMYISDVNKETNKVGIEKPTEEYIKNYWDSLKEEIKV